jgi:hypothetical protein
MAKEKVIKDKTYRLLNGSPLTFVLASRNQPRFPLMWFDEKKNQNRILRYAINQNSPFEDEQDNNPILEPIVFEDGMLYVPKNNPVLQEFLYYHPQNGTVFAELDKEKEASEDVSYLNLEVDALVEARSLDINQMEMLTRVIFGKDPSTLSTAEMKRDILVFARQDPQTFMDMVKDPELKFQAKVRMFFDGGLLVVKNDKDIYFNTPTSKKKMCSIAFGSDAFDMAISYLQSDEGIDSLKMLETLLSED